MGSMKIDTVDKETVLRKIVEKLSDDQRRAVESNKKHIRILAGAGAGKTETLTRRILYLLLYKDVDPEKIVAFTFTERAAQDIKSRIYRRVTEIAGEEFATKLGRMYIGTIHGYALRILQDYFGKADYEVLDDNQEMAFIMRRGWEIGINKLEGKSYGEKCKKFLDEKNKPHKYYFRERGNITTAYKYYHSEKEPEEQDATTAILISDGTENCEISHLSGMERLKNIADQSDEEIFFYVPGEFLENIRSILKS